MIESSLQGLSVISDNLERRFGTSQTGGNGMYHDLYRPQALTKTNKNSFWFSVVQGLGAPPSFEFFQMTEILLTKSAVKLDMEAWTAKLQSSFVSR